MNTNGALHQADTSSLKCPPCGASMNVRFRLSHKSSTGSLSSWSRASTARCSRWSHTYIRAFDSRERKRKLLLSRAFIPSRKRRRYQPQEQARITGTCGGNGGRPSAIKMRRKLVFQLKNRYSPCVEQYRRRGLSRAAPKMKLYNGGEKRIATLGKIDLRHDANTKL